MKHKGASCIVQRTEKSLLYETERALRATLPIFVAGCHKIRAGCRAMMRNLSDGEQVVGFEFRRTCVVF